MMKYKGFYWNFLAPCIKKSIKKRYGCEMAKKAICNGKVEYKKLLQIADDIGDNNPMAMNAYFAYTFVGAWLGTKKKISPNSMADIMVDVLYMLKPFFRIVNINSKRGEKKWYREMKKYEAWSNGKLEKYPTTWIVNFDESRHNIGSFYYFTRCPICEFCKKEGIPEIMPALCATDSVMFKLQHGVLHRKCTLANGDNMCDYWIVGDKYKIHNQNN
ncbi:hypothetical protein SH1V18_37260 [Vallitalea longa]|uniref:L-2-amino-thiazoline-4-carboxylic acid hydrolase n=1 Tax=Vallitalea longa TaxID=2936439 RepID=A0A9W6DFI1_9FIRM|nr:L-2-amino-thiazoline-4-carboxylic acid hydrolase [Vallitalea longa]GKX31246.1 hypothetical protein SH1V18_37260 [Vallitalea longa]